MNTKTCTKCGEEKPATPEFFYKDTRQSDGCRPDCKVCTSARTKRKYKTDPVFRQQKLDKAAEYQKGARKEQQKRLLTILKNSGCVDCGNTDPLVLDFDHVRGIKVDGISRMIRSHCSWEQIEEEIAKCEVRCANCHRKKTARERKYYEGIDLSSL